MTSISLQDLGAIGEVVGGVAVVVSLIYVAHQIRQSSRQIEQNSRQIEASMYHVTNDAFYRWFAVLAQDEKLAGLWRRALAGEPLQPEETTRVHALLAMLFLSYENNFQQIRLGALRRDTLEIARSDLVGLLSRPVARAWWDRQGRQTLTPEFRRAVDALVRNGRTATDAASREASATEREPEADG